MEATSNKSLHKNLLLSLFFYSSRIVYHIIFSSCFSCQKCQKAEIVKTQRENFLLLRLIV